MKNIFLFIFLFACLQIFPASAREYLSQASDTVVFPVGCEGREITVAVNDTICLSGTLTIPADGQKSHPAVVIISGTGQQDRDGTFGPHRPFCRIAAYLAVQGVAVLRTDDRGTGRSTGVYAEATTRDFADDALLMVAALKRQPGIDPQRIGLLGHSEGGAAVMMAAKNSSDVAFVITLAGLSTDGLTALKLQNNGLIRAARHQNDTWKEANIAFLEPLFGWVAAVPAGQRLEESVKAEYYAWLKQQPDTLLKILNLKHREDIYISRYLQVADTRWYREMMAYEPADYVPFVRVPVLAFYGEKDVMVPAAENSDHLERLLKQGGNTCYRIVNMPGLNHMMQHCIYGTPDEYVSLEEDIAPEVLGRIGEWLKERYK